MGIFAEMDLPPCCEALEHHTARPVRPIPINQYPLPLFVEAVRLQYSKGQFDGDGIEGGEYTLVAVIFLEFLKVFIENVSPVEELRGTIVLILLICHLLIVSFHLSSHLLLFGILQ
jgi:hypothetical protein